MIGDVKKYAFLGVAIPILCFGAYRYAT